MLSYYCSVQKLIPFSVGASRVQQFLGLQSCQLYQPLQNYNTQTLSTTTVSYSFCLQFTQAGLQKLQK